MARVFRTGARPVRRLTLQWEDGQWSVTRERRVHRKVLLSPSRVPARDPNGLVGFWWEVVDEQGRTVHRRVVHDPLRQWVSITRDDGSRANLDVRRPSARFEVVIYDDPGYHELRLYGQQRSCEVRTATSELLATFSLRRPYDEEPDGRK